MPDPRTRQRPGVVGDARRDEAVVAIDGVSGRTWLQSADVILGGAPDHVAAARWTAGVLRRFPGCAVAGVRHMGGRWLLLVGRSGERLEKRAPAAPGLSFADIEQVARAAYLHWARSSRVCGGSRS